MGGIKRAFGWLPGGKVGTVGCVPGQTQRMDGTRAGL